MANAPLAQPPEQARRLPLPVGYLYTPPEQAFDSFSKSTDDTQGIDLESPSQTKLPPITVPVPSPPTSPPDAQAWASFRPVEAYRHQVDPPLYPGSRGRALSQIEPPLFFDQMTLSPKTRSGKENNRPESQTDEESVAGESFCRNDPLPFGSPASQTQRDQRKSRGSSSHAEMLNIRNAGDAVAYFHERMRELKQLRSVATPPPTKLDEYDRRQVRSLGKPAGVTKSKVTARSPPKPAAKTVTKPKVAQRGATPRRSPKVATYQEFTDAAFPQQDKKHKRAAPTKSVVGKEDNNKWTDLPDFCPPLSTLDNTDKKLKVEWKHGPLDYSNKEDVEQLHPEEQRIASTLRLEPKQYLANKRRIFAARLEQLRNPSNKGWNKTACQQACNIDVNKASQLYEAFSRIGWFEEHHFQQWV